MVFFQCTNMSNIDHQPSSSRIKDVRNVRTNEERNATNLTIVRNNADDTNRVDDNINEENTDQRSNDETYCCEKRCLTMPRTVVDGQLDCGCFSWCTCSCCTRIAEHLTRVNYTQNVERRIGRYEFVDLARDPNSRYCCELRCVRMPETVVDGPIRCGCWSWCVCNCRARKSIPSRHVNESILSKRTMFLDSLLK